MFMGGAKLALGRGGPPENQASRGVNINFISRPPPPEQNPEYAPELET